MSSQGPTLVSLEAGSAWTVIVAVSLLTAPAALLLRRAINRPGGLASGLLLASPLALPVVAASVFHQGLLPEVAVLRPATTSVLRHSGRGLLHYLFVVEGRERVIPYALSGYAGRWLMVAGLAVALFMLLRRMLGGLLLHRTVKRSLPVEETPYAHIRALVDRLSAVVGLRRVPDVLVLQEGTAVAAATGIRRGRILLSEHLLVKLTDEELEAILAHEIAHLAAHDIGLVVVAGILRDMVAWNPIGHFAFRRLQLHRELEADRRAAALTGKPLMIASTLLSVWELNTRPAGLSMSDSNPALLSRQRALPTRVSRLLALADGRIPTAAAAHPYLVGILAVVALGFAAASGVARQDGQALAIMLGDAPPAERMAVWNDQRDVWRMKLLLSRQANRSRAIETPRRAEENGAASQRWLGLDGGYALRVKDVPRWSRLTKRLVASPQTLQWEAEQIRLFSRPHLGPVGLFRIQPTPRPTPRAAT